MPLTLGLMQFYHNASDFFNEYEFKTCILFTKSLLFKNDLGSGVLGFTISQTTPSSKYGDITTTNNNYQLFSYFKQQFVFILTQLTPKNRGLYVVKVNAF